MEVSVRRLYIQSESVFSWSHPIMPVPLSSYTQNGHIQCLNATRHILGCKFTFGTFWFEEEISLLSRSFSRNFRWVPKAFFSNLALYLKLKYDRKYIVVFILKQWETSISWSRIEHQIIYKLLLYFLQSVFSATFSIK